MAMLLVLALMQSAPLDVAGAVAAQECGRDLKGDDAVVCGRRGQRERYRMPDRDKGWDPDAGVESVMRERHRWAEGGEAGVDSCGPVGPAGHTGCFARSFNQRMQQTQWKSNIPTKRW